MPTTVTPGKSVGSLNGVTSVTIVGSPAASTQRTVRTITVKNVDTVAHLITLSLEDSTTDYEFIEANLQPGQSLIYTDNIVLSDTDDTVEGWSDATATTTEPTFTAAWMDAA